jgi:Putative Ig domain
MANTARVTQSVIEFVALGIGEARVTQSVIEFVVGLGISCDNPPGGTTGIFYTHTFPAGAGQPPYSFAITAGALPPGLTLAAATGIVSGVPTTQGTYIFTVTVTDSSTATASVQCSIVIAGQPISILLYGWKLYPDRPCEPAEEVEEVPSVTRAV